MPLLSDKINLSNWNQLLSISEVEELMCKFGGFGDCILIESHIWGECYVDEELCIVYPPGPASDQKARVTFQRQGAPLKAIEVLFIELKSVTLKCRDSSSDGIINSATITKNKIGDISFVAKASNDKDAEVIFSGSAKSIFWRALEEENN